MVCLGANYEEFLKTINSSFFNKSTKDSETSNYLHKFHTKLNFFTLEVFLTEISSKLINSVESGDFWWKVRDPSWEKKDEVATGMSARVLAAQRRRPGLLLPN